MNVFITGCNGFLGRTLLQSLRDKYNLTGIEIGQHKNIDNIQIFTPEEILQTKIQPDVIVMCHAAVSSGTYQVPTDKLFLANVDFTDKLAKRFPESYLLYISSVSVYGDKEGVYDEKSLPSPVTEYAISKLWGEKIVSSFKNYGILRLTSLYGIGMKENTIIPNYINQALSHQEIQVWGKGERRQNYVFVEEVADYIDKMIAQKSPGIHISASSYEINNAYLAKIISEETGAKINFVKEDNSPSITIDNSLTRKKLNKADNTDLSENLKKYIHWKQKQY